MKPIGRHHSETVRAECLERTKYKSRCQWEQEFTGDDAYEQAKVAAAEHAQQKGHFVVASRWVQHREWYAEDEALTGRAIPAL